MLLHSFRTNVIEIDTVVCFFSLSFMLSTCTCLVPNEQKIAFKLLVHIGIIPALVAVSSRNTR